MGLHESKERIKSVRARAWSLTSALLIALVAYLFVNVVLEQHFSIVDFVIVSTLQILAHGTYFPEGELFGQTNKEYIANRALYNSKATEICNKKRIHALREYCVVEFEERKTRYIQKECTAIGVTVDEFEELKKKTKKEIMQMKSIITDDKILILTWQRKKRLIKLIYGRLPIGYNRPETILSAIDNTGDNELQDQAVRFKRRRYAKKISRVLIWGLFLSFISYSVKDTITIADIVRIIVYAVSLFSTAVTSYSSGETCSKVYKNRFYIDLANFIDGFNEWVEKGE